MARPQKPREQEQNKRDSGATTQTLSIFIAALRSLSRVSVTPAKAKDPLEMRRYLVELSLVRFLQWGLVVSLRLVNAAVYVGLPMT